MPDQSPTIFLSAGEASGEHYGALLMEELISRFGSSGIEPRFIGMGGNRMEALGLQCIVRSEDVAVMGITEIVRHLPQIYREYRKLKSAIQTLRPDIAVLIDFPDIHLKLASEFQRLGIPVIFFVSPQLWAWKKGRIRKVQRFVDRMLVIFPFEEPFYRERSVDARYVGHPLADLPLPAITTEEFAKANGLDPERTWIGLLPGSRIKEIRLNLPGMLASARLLLKNNHGLQFVLPLAPTLTAMQRQEALAMAEAEAQALGKLPLKFVDDARATLFRCRASIVASGTATVEAALIGNPFVVVYRVSPLTYAIAKRVVTVPHVAMVNLVADQRLVPELIQDDFHPPAVVQALEPLLADGPARSKMVAGLAEVGRKLRSGRAAEETAIGTVAGEVLAMLQNGKPGMAQV
ncbi:lipid-A-disaccharide synthase [Acidicapsa dinghuensis]|uniref:Lipid-A-disaccharide synthase n=1 Tax=Acidicapsa dinghuensis TaxID=2218256 RepID=A0ABW1EGY0_9BACT|nr:lipid-A-disaccharide synthase [Acidicapsa dinghuensis]